MLPLQKILDVAGCNNDWVIETLKTYLKIPSISAQKMGIPESVRFLTNIFRAIDFIPKVYETDGGAPIVFAYKSAKGISGWGGSSVKPKTILFYNHYDVQPPEPLDEWLSPPFEPTFREGKIFARGISDNKGDLVARIAAMKAFKDADIPLPVNVKFVVEGEEEIGSPHLANFVDNFRNELTPHNPSEAQFYHNPQGLKADLCIWECGGRTKNGMPKILLGYKGILQGELVCKTGGSDMHSSKGIIFPNPLWRLVWALSTIKARDENILIKGFYDNIVSPSDEEKELLSKMDSAEILELGTSEIQTLPGQSSNPISSNFTNGVQPSDSLLYRYFYSPTFTLNGFVGGYQGKGNKTVLPHIASAKFDIRLVPNMEPNDILKKLRRHLDENGFEDIEISKAKGYPSAKTSCNHPILKAVKEASKMAWDKEPIIYPTSPASSPMYLFREFATCVGLGIGHPQSNEHAPNESVYADDLKKGIRHIIYLLNNFAEIYPP